MKFTRLLCNGMEQPLGYDFHHPRLTWVVDSPHRDDGQVAYRLEVALEPSFAATVYDSGRTTSDQTAQVPLPLDLDPCTRYYWRVTVWSRGEATPATSPVTWFETARYALPWTGRFITSRFDLPQLRRRFTLHAPVRRARLYACGVGLYKMFLNGAPVSAEELAPGFCAYDCWLPYQTYDVTAQLRPGENILGAWLGNGYYKGRVSWPGMEERRCIYGDENALIAELAVELENGETLLIPTDERWEASPSPFVRAEIYDGEVFDSRLWDRSWTLSAGEKAWEGVRLAKLDTSLLQARKNLPVRVMGTFRPTLLHAPNGDTLLDFGQNASGRIRVRGQWPAGTEIRLQTGEVLDKDGNLYRENLRTALSEQVYICDGQPCDYAPTFTFFGFRYARVLGLDTVDPECFTMEVLYSAMEQTGQFSCSDPMVNRLFLNALWGQKSNFVDNPTDCPQRDERMGWTGDAQVFAPTACLNMNAQQFFHKYLYDLACEQKKTGFVPVTVPNILFKTNMWGIPTTGWSDAAVLIPWTLYLHYGDLDILAQQYESMTAWVDYMTAQDKDGTHLYGGFHLGDWLAQDTKDPNNLFGLTPTGLIATAFYAYSATLTGYAAHLLGKEEDARAYAQLAAQVREAFRQEYVSPSGRVISETQTAYVIALMMDMLTPEQRNTAIEHLAERLRIDHVMLTTGFLGTPYICPVLSACGLNEYAYTLLLQKECPSWLFEVSMGATTVWERWNSMRADHSFGPVSMNSFNHYAFGSVAQWLYEYVAGIRPLPEGAGFRRFRLEPMPNSLLAHAEASLQSPQGMISSRWALVGEKLQLTFDVPFGACAEIVLPDAGGAAVLENGEPLPLTEAPLVRGSGRWTYSYVPNGATIHRRVPGEQRPPY